MFDRFKEFIGIDDNYDEYDDDQAYYDDEDYSRDEVSSSSRRTYSDMIDEDINTHTYHDEDRTITYESGYTTQASTQSPSYSSYSQGTDTYQDLTDNYSPSTYKKESNYKRSGRRGDNVVSMTENNFRSSSNMRISIQEPLDYEKDAPSVINDILDKKVVVLNLEMVDSDMRRRIFDFVSGAVYALEGTVEKVTKGIFVITPKGVEVDNTITEQISDGNYNQL